MPLDVLGIGRVHVRPGKRQVVQVEGEARQGHAGEQEVAEERDRNEPGDEAGRAKHDAAGWS